MRLLIIILLSLPAVLNAQNFEGTLTYVSDIEISQKMLDLGISKDDLIERMVNDGTWTDTISTAYSNGYYKQLNLSREKSWVIYRPDSNKIYTLLYVGFFIS